MVGKIHFLRQNSDTRLRYRREQEGLPDCPRRCEIEALLRAHCGQGGDVPPTVLTHNLIVHPIPHQRWARLSAHYEVEPIESELPRINVCGRIDAIAAKDVGLGATL